MIKMTVRNLLISLIGIAALLLAVTGAAATAQAKPGKAKPDKPNKVSVCHLDEEDGSFHLIEVAAPAVTAHKAHGDDFDDLDGDGLANSCDPDGDNDGVDNDRSGRDGDVHDRVDVATDGGCDDRALVQRHD